MKFRHYLLLLLPLVLFAGCNKPVTEEEDEVIDIPPIAKDYPYEITSVTKLSSLHELLRLKHLESLNDAAEEYLKETCDKPVDMINFTYPSVGPDGKEVTLSARMYILDMLYGFGKTTLGIALANHASIVEADQCPTRDVKEEGAAAWLGIAVVMPDYYGFGASEDKPQAYLNSACTAKGSLDAFKTARKILHDKGVIAGRDYYNFGYSQGGFNTIANLKYLSDHPEENLKFKISFAGAGSYDINASLDEYLKDTYPAASIFIPMTVIGTNECENLGLDYAKMFREPLLSGYKEWILSKKYSFGTIMRNIGTTKLSEILTSGMVDGSSDEVKKLREILETYSVCKGWTPANGTKILLYHSLQDDVVPSFNSDILCSYLTSIGADVQLVKGEDGGHTDAELAFLYAMASMF